MCQLQTPDSAALRRLPTETPERLRELLELAKVRVSASAAAGLLRGDRKLTVLSVSATALITSYLTDHTCVFKPVILCHHRDLWQGSMGPLLSTLDVSVFHWCLRMVAQRVQHFYTMLNKKVSTWHIKL